MSTFGPRARHNFRGYPSKVRVKPAAKSNRAPFGCQAERSVGSARSPVRGSGEGAAPPAHARGAGGRWLPAGARGKAPARIGP